MVHNELCIHAFVCNMRVCNVVNVKGCVFVCLFVLYKTGFCGLEM